MTQALPCDTKDSKNTELVDLIVQFCTREGRVLEARKMYVMFM